MKKQLEYEVGEQMLMPFIEEELIEKKELIEGLKVLVATLLCEGLVINVYLYNHLGAYQSITNNIVNNITNYFK